MQIKPQSIGFSGSNNFEFGITYTDTTPFLKHGKWPSKQCHAEWVRRKRMTLTSMSLQTGVPRPQHIPQEGVALVLSVSVTQSAATTLVTVQARATRLSNGPLPDHSARCKPRSQHVDLVSLVQQEQWIPEPELPPVAAHHSASKPAAKGQWRPVEQTTSGSAAGDARELSDIGPQQ